MAYFTCISSYVIHRSYQFASFIELPEKFKDTNQPSNKRYGYG
jgi:hypothetical protein